jgi:hypothetical protein
MSPDRTDPEQDSSASRVAAGVVLAVGLLAGLLLFPGRFWSEESASREHAQVSFPPEPEPVLLPAPPIDDEYFPCGDCHEGEPTNPARRELDEHDQIELAHGDLWCLDCHDADQRESLRRSDNALIAFEESWRLCTRCHGNKLSDWRAGIHGKRTGNWRGPKEYRTCVVCHDPHTPRFESLEPEPRPLRAIEIRLPRRVELVEAAHEAR